MNNKTLAELWNTPFLTLPEYERLVVDLIPQIIPRSQRKRYLREIDFVGKAINRMYVSDTKWNPLGKNTLKSHRIESFRWVVVYFYHQFYKKPNRKTANKTSKYLKTNTVPRLSLVNRINPENKSVIIRGEKYHINHITTPSKELEARTKENRAVIDCLLTKSGLSAKYKLIAQRMSEGDTYVEIGAELGLSKQRIHQLSIKIINSLKVTALQHNIDWSS